jgi:hypothetical protein
MDDTILVKQGQFKGCVRNLQSIKGNHLILLGFSSNLKEIFFYLPYIGNWDINNTYNQMEMIMILHKKVTYRLSQTAIRYIENRSLLDDIPKSKVLSMYIKNAFEFFDKEYAEEGELINKGVKKQMKWTIPKTFTIPVKLENELTFYSKMLGIKKSHLVIVACIYCEEDLDTEKLAEECMKLIR